MTLAHDLADPVAALGAVVRVLPADRPELIASALRKESVRTLALDFVVTKDAQDLRSAIASGLGFPDHYGWNWDALADIFYEIRESGVETVMLVVEDAVTLLADQPADRDIFLSLLSDLLDQRRGTDPSLPVLVRLVDLAESDSEFGGVSISLSLVVDEPLESEPEVLVDARRRDARHYGCSLHLADIEKPSGDVNSFLRAQLEKLDTNGINSEWVLQNRARVRAYLSIHPGVRTPSVAFEPDVVAGLTSLGATIDIDVL